MVVVVIVQLAISYSIMDKFVGLSINDNLGEWLADLIIDINVEHSPTYGFIAILAAIILQ